MMFAVKSVGQPQPGLFISFQQLQATSSSGATMDDGTFSTATTTTSTSYFDTFIPFAGITTTSQYIPVSM
jgi:hypothetical protein